jgi:hypothetical protein
MRGASIVMYCAEMYIKSQEHTVVVTYSVIKYHLLCFYIEVSVTFFIKNPDFLYVFVLLSNHHSCLNFLNWTHVRLTFLLKMI